jgi:hypothetical protein
VGGRQAETQETLVHSSSPGTEICKRAEQLHADLIVIGLCSRVPLGECVTFWTAFVIT